MAADRKTITAPTAEAIAAAERQQREFREFQQSEEYLSAVRAETEGRDEAFIDVPLPVCGVRLRQLSAIDLLRLSVMRSPFIAASFISGERKPVDLLPNFAAQDFFAKRILIPRQAIPAFLWMQSVVFLPRSGSALARLRARLRWWFFVRRCRGLKYGESCEAIRGYVAAALVDKPQGGRGGPAPVASWIAGSVSFIASKFHWPERDILNMPLARLFQYERAIIASAGGRHTVPNRSDSLKAAWLKQRRANN